jgi:hypothetical protein
MGKFKGVIVFENDTFLFKNLEEISKSINEKNYDCAVRSITERKYDNEKFKERYLFFNNRKPHRIIFIRHAESMANINEEVHY